MIIDAVFALGLFILCGFRWFAEITILAYWYGDKRPEPKPAKVRTQFDGTVHWQKQPI